MSSVVNMWRLAWADVSFPTWIIIIIIPIRLGQLIGNDWLQVEVKQEQQFPRGEPDPPFEERPGPNQVNHGWPHVKDEPAYRRANYCHSQVSPATGPQILPILAIHLPGWMGSGSRGAVSAGWWGWCRSRRATIARQRCLGSVSGTGWVGRGAAWSDPNTVRKVRAGPGLHSSQPLLLPLSLYALHVPATKTPVCCRRYLWRPIPLSPVHAGNHVVVKAVRMGGVNTNTKQSRWLSVS